MARPIPLLPPLTNATLPSKPTAPPPRSGGTIGAGLKAGPEPSGPARRPGRPAEGAVAGPGARGLRRRGSGATDGDRRCGPPPTRRQPAHPARRALDGAPPRQLPIPRWHPSRPTPPVGQTEAVGEEESALAGRAIGITADRRWEEQADLFRRRGATIVHGPTMTTRLLHEDQE